MNKHINLILPPFFNLIIFKKNNFIKINIYNNNYIFNITLNTLNKLNIQINKNNNYLKIFYKNIKNNQILINNTINTYLKLLDVYLFSKIKFKGKGFKLGFYKKKKILNFFFGTSHINTIVFKNLILKKINKYKFYLKNTNKKTLNYIIKTIINIKKINFYTLRGLRISRQKITKRKGRKGTFI